MLKVLRRIVQEVAAAPTLEEALALVVSHVQESMQADACSIFLTDEERGEYVLMASVGLNPDVIGKVRLKFGQGLVGLVAEREEPINLDDISEHPDNLMFTDLGDAVYSAFMGVPVIYRSELLGVIVVQHREKRFFAESEEAFLVTLAVQLAVELTQAIAKGALIELKQSNRKRKSTPKILHGLPGSPGVGIGTVTVVVPPADLDAVPDKQIDNVDAELALFDAAMIAARDEMHTLQTRAKSSLSSAESALFDAYSRLLDSRSLMDEVASEIKSGQWAQGSLKRVIKKHILQFESLDDPYLQERASDFRDLGRRILAKLQLSEPTVSLKKPMILVSEEVTATMLMEVPEKMLLGIVSAAGSGNSHVAILARALGVPTVMGVTGVPLTGLDGKEFIVDGYNGEVYISPPASIKKEYKHLAQEEAELDQELSTLRDLPAETQDGVHVSLTVNTGLVAEGGLSLSVGAEGVGLYRTEIPFMMRDRFPSEEEQRLMYRQLLNAFAPRPVVMRTLDIGGDKSLPYFPIEEDNPFLGWRGVRITLDQPEIFLQQVRAMLSASVDLDNLSILLPMVSTVSDVDISVRLIHQAYNELKEEGMSIKKPELGVMIEVPAAVYQAFELASKVDFLSVGSNDLIQYMLAVDRNNARVADRYDGLHPAVLKALKLTVDSGHKAGKKVAICGELASDPIAIVLLLGMGYDRLSMSARSLPRAKKVVRTFSQADAEGIVKDVLKIDDTREIRTHMEMILEDAGLGGLIRAGK